MNNKERIIIMKVISEISVIEKMILGYSEVSFFSDEKTQRAVSMTLINIGELVKSHQLNLEKKIQIFLGEQ